MTPWYASGCWGQCLVTADTQQVTEHSHKGEPPTAAADHARSQWGQRAAPPGNCPIPVKAEAYLEGGDADAVHQVWLVGLQQGDEGQQLVLAAHLVLAV